jgi:hypothetical protein
MQVSSHDRRPIHRGAPTMAEMSLSIRESPQGIQTMRTRSVGIATGTREPPPERWRTETVPQAASRQPRHVTEVTRQPPNDRTGFPALPQVGMTDRCWLEPRRARAAPTAKPQHQAEIPRTDQRPWHPPWGKRQHLRTRPCGLALWRRHPPWSGRRSPPNKTLRPCPLAT